MRENREMMETESDMRAIYPDPIDYRELARELAESLQVMVNAVPKGLTTPQLLTLFEKRHENAKAALAKYREQGKEGGV